MKEAYTAIRTECGPDRDTDLKLEISAEWNGVELSLEIIAQLKRVVEQQMPDLMDRMTDGLYPPRAGYFSHFVGAGCIGAGKTSLTEAIIKHRVDHMIIDDPLGPCGQDSLKDWYVQDLDSHFLCGSSDRIPIGVLQLGRTPGKSTSIPKDEEMEGYVEVFKQSIFPGCEPGMIWEGTRKDFQRTKGLGMTVYMLIGLALKRKGQKMFGPYTAKYSKRVTQTEEK